MRKLLFAVALALPLVGCGTVSVLEGGTCLTCSVTNPVGRNELAVVENSYGVVLSAAVAYRRLYLSNPCKAGDHATLQNICGERSLVLHLQSADQKAHSALVIARKFIRDNPTISAASLVSAAETAVGDFRAIAVTVGAM